ncbi:MAG: CPBP family intramembrane glutamic endopeptidase [Chloroflexota bacterium]
MSTEPGPPTLNLAGLRLPWRETVVVLVTTFVLLIDFHHGLTLPLGPASQGLMRVVLYLVVPVGVLLLLGERPSAYGLRIGDWRVGFLVAGAFAVAATPVILVVAGLPEFQAYYHRSATDLTVALLSNGVDVAAAEFLFRGFLMWTLVRLAGPMGVVLATFPFVFTHLGKPELETLSTFFGGMGFGWLAWRTRSVLYGALLHVYLISLIVIATSS